MYVLKEYNYTLQFFTALFVGILFYIGINLILKTESINFVIDAIKKRNL
jgi:hypothetical protein